VDAPVLEYICLGECVLSYILIMSRG